MANVAGPDGVLLVYETAGSGDPPILFLHGWACDRSYFEAEFEHFARSHAVATMDLRGHGDSARPEPGAGVYEVDTCAQDALAVADAAGLERPLVVGHSLGALIALACAAQPNAVRAAVMVDPAPIVNEAVKQFLGQGADLVETDHDASWRTSFAEGWFMPTDSVRRGEIISGVSSLPPAIAAASLRAIAEFDGTTALRAVEVPLLSIGSASPTDSPADLRDACPTIMIGQTVGSGHFNQLEVPEQINPMMERFLAINGLGN